MTQFEKMVSFLDRTYDLKDQLVPCLVGPVGIGKTAAVMQHASNVGARQVVRIIASQVLPSEVSGITMPDKETESMKIYDHYRLSHLEDGDILFFDELLEADQTVLSACLTLIEDRMMMSGRKLPDIQIIAATNPTIIPTSLKENIRQRFMFMTFTLDQVQVAEFIQKDTGLAMSDRVLGRLQSTGSGYNILSPRSLTKLCRWVMATPEDQLDVVGDFIDNMFDSFVGKELVRIRRSQADMLRKRKVRDEAAKLMPDHDFSNCSFEELLVILQAAPEWEQFKEHLEQTEV